VSDPTEFGDLIGDIYDCILNPERWNEVLGTIEKQIGATSSYLLLHEINSNARSMNVFIERNVADDMRQGYLDHYIKLNPVLPYLSSIAAGETYSCGHLVTQPKFLKGEFYQEWAAPQGWFDYAGVTLIRERDAAAAIGFSSAGEGNVFDDAALALLRRLAPHLTRAAQVQRLLEREQAARADLAKLLDAARFGALIVDADARIRYANPAAETLLARREGIANDGGLLTAGTATSALRAALRASARRDAMSSAGRTLLADRGPGRRPLVVHVIPAIDQSRAKLDPVRAATAFVYLLDPEIRPDGLIDAFGDAYRLTRAERQVLARLVAGDTPKEITAALGVGMATVRTHLQRLFAKTDTRRQAELLTLLLQSAPQIGRR
jgi:DNA-binding CsgD family transcriptional regulator/PAS domain-containing protein